MKVRLGSITSDGVVPTVDDRVAPMLKIYIEFPFVLTYKFIHLIKKNSARKFECVTK